MLVSLSGSNVVDGGSVQASFEKDLDGNGVLRTADAMPIGYDVPSDSWVNKCLDEVTLIASITITAGTTYNLNINPVNCKSFNIMVQETTSTAAKVRIYNGYYDQDGVFYTQPADILNTTSTPATVALSTLQTVQTNYIRLFVQNTDTVDHTFKLKMTRFFV